MSQRNLSISNSEQAKWSGIGNSIRTLFWVAASIVLIDFLINIVFAYPTNPKADAPSRLQAYFEYGRSIEGKLARMTRSDRSQTAPITLSGWYEPLEVEEAANPSQKAIVTFYGMSHAEKLAYALGRTSDKFIPRIVAAPAATANWAYGAFLRDRGGHKSRVVILAFMSANLPMITTVSPMTWNIDFPMPYTADRFYLDGSRLRIVPPTFGTFEQYVETFYNPPRWTAFRDMLSKNDSAYDAFIMSANILDRSSLLRLVRRAYGQRMIRNMRHAVLDQTGYRPDSEQLKLANAIAQRFAEQARTDGMIPIIYIVNNFGYSNYLTQALKPTLKVNNIPYLSSDSIASPNDPRKYLPNSHFTDETDDELARALSGLIEKSL